jgi:hypothetical protein
MSQEFTQEQTIEQIKDEASAEGAAPETAAAEPTTFPDQDEPDRPAEA